MNNLSFGIAALAIVGASWCLVGVVLGRAPKDGLDTGLLQLAGAVVSMAISVVIFCIIGFDSAPLPVKLVVCGVYFAGGVFNYIGLQTMAEAMQRGPNGIIWCIAQSALIFPFVVGVLFFGVALTLPRCIGIALLTAALIFFGLAKENGISGSGGRWKKWAFLSLTVFAIQQNLCTAPSYYPEAREVSSILRTMGMAAGTFCAGAWSFVRRFLQERAAAGRMLAGLRRGRFWIYVGVLQIFCLILSYTLFFPGMDAMAKAGAGAVCYPLLVGSCIVAFTLYSALVLREPLRRLQYLALALCLAGLFCLCFPD